MTRKNRTSTRTANATSDHVQHSRTLARRFRALLSREATEVELQRELALNPLMLADGLPVRIPSSAITALGRRGKSEADFEFVSNESGATRFGVVELKSPCHRITRLPRKGVVSLTASASTAIQQARTYGAELRNRVIATMGDNRQLAASAELYVVIGRSIQPDVGRLESLNCSELGETLPADVRLLTYDSLFQRFVSRNPIRNVESMTRKPKLPDWTLWVPSTGDDAPVRVALAQSIDASRLRDFRSTQFYGITRYAQAIYVGSARDVTGTGRGPFDQVCVLVFAAESAVWFALLDGARMERLERHSTRDELTARLEFGCGEKLLHATVEMAGSRILFR